MLEEHCVVYSEIELQFDCRLVFIGLPHSAEPDRFITGICTAYDRDMQSWNGPGSEKIPLVYANKIFLRFGISFYGLDIPGISSLSLFVTRICQAYDKMLKDMTEVSI